MSKVKFKEWSCKIEFGRYGNGNIALTLVDENDGEPSRSCNCKYCRRENSRGFSCNQELIEYGIVSKPVSFIGNIGAPLCKLLISEA